MEHNSSTQVLTRSEKLPLLGEEHCNKWPFWMHIGCALRSCGHGSVGLRRTVGAPWGLYGELCAQQGCEVGRFESKIGAII